MRNKISRRTDIHRPTDVVEDSYSERSEQGAHLGQVERSQFVYQLATRRSSLDKHAGSLGRHHPEQEPIDLPHIDAVSNKRTFDSTHESIIDSICVDSAIPRWGVALGHTAVPTESRGGMRGNSLSAHSPQNTPPQYRQWCRQTSIDLSAFKSC